MNYFITSEKEVLREVASSIIAKITRYMIAHNIETDHKNPISIMLDQVDEISDSLIGNTNNTMEDLEKVNTKLIFARNYIDEVVKANG